MLCSMRRVTCEMARGTWPVVQVASPWALLAASRTSGISETTDSLPWCSASLAHAYMNKRHAKVYISRLQFQIDLSDAALRCNRSPPVTQLSGTKCNSATKRCSRKHCASMTKITTHAHHKLPQMLIPRGHSWVSSADVA